MITKISGKLVTLHLDAAIIEAAPFEYEVLIPEYTRRQLQGELGKRIALYTLYFMDGNPQMGKQVPRLIGFLTEVEREFFDLFCSVDGIGTRKALRAMLRPVRDVAAAIEEQDVKFLSSLPGIGPAMAERVVAKLRRKVPKFALMVARDLPEETPADLVRETYDALLTLGHSEADARRLIDAALEAQKKYKDSAELIQAIYRNSR